MKALLLTAAAVAAQQAMPMEPHSGGHAAMIKTRADVQARVTQRFAKLDANRDGFLTQAEAATGHAQRMAMMQKRRAARAQGSDSAAMFERMDTNHDGVITRAEFDAVPHPRHNRMAQRGAHAPRGAGQMFVMADVNHDGRVSLAEAQATALQRFDRLDVDHNGSLTPAERQQGRQQWRAQHRG